MNNRWFQFKFRFHTEEGRPPQWWLDLAVFDSVVRGVVRNFQSRIVLWRIHRRAGRDAAGHQFSLLVYTDEETATEIYEKVEDATIVRTLHEAALLKEYVFDNEDTACRRRVEGKSDPSWPIEIQRSWPHFIMGASEMCVALVGELKAADDTPDPSEGTMVLERYYEELSERLNNSWQQDGSHAYLHHLNALFGHTPVLLKPRRIFGALVNL